MLAAPARWVLLALVAVSILWASVSSGGPVRQAQAAIPLDDLALHMLGYTLLAGAALYAWLPDRGRPLHRGLLVFAVVLLYGIALELVQARIPGRVPDLLDALANGLGAATALAWAPILARYTDDASCS